MKSLLLIATVLLASTARAGGSAEGGGNLMIQLSTPDQVSTAIDKAVRDANSDLIIQNLSLGSSLLRDELNEFFEAEAPVRLVELVKEIWEQNKVLSTFDNMRIEKKNGPCLTADGTEVDASVNDTDPKAPVCFSLTRLGRLPQGLLNSQLRPLVIHEVMHKMGYGEADAQLMQMYHLAEVISGRAGDRRGFIAQMKQTGEAAKKALAHLDAGKREETTDALASVRTSLQNAMERVVRSNQERGDVKKENLEKLKPIVTKDFMESQYLWVSLGTKKDSSKGVSLTLETAYALGRINARDVRKRLNVVIKATQQFIGVTPLLFPLALTRTTPGNQPK